MKIAIVDSRISPECERGLNKEGFYLLKLPPDASLGEAVCSHPDTVLFYSRGEIFTTADYCEGALPLFSDIREFKPEIKISFTSDKRSEDYPHDCVMNALALGDRLFCKADSVSGAILDFARRHGMKICPVKQGYPACTTLAFGNSAITADKGMANAMREEGITVTEISQGGISLSPYEYGFIGGAGGVYNKKVYFFGDLSTHPDSEIIRRAIEDSGYTPVSLSGEPLADMGGIIFL